jgi:uncharacterized membrane-anchored protein YhcB (DUF1043 family)
MFYPNQPAMREDIREYVAQLQLHMALQARNLVPSLTNTKDSREKLLQDTQATIEKIVSRNF